MAIKNEQFLKELLPFSKVTVVPGVTVGDLNFASAQSIFSTCYFQPSADETFDANQDKDLFQAAIGDNGQGLAAGQVMSRGQTNFVDSQGRLPANEVFVGIRCLISAYKHTNASNSALSGASFALSGTAYSKQAPITDVAALYQILSQFSWEYQIGDGIIRNSGALIGFPQGGGAYQPQQFISGTAAAAAIAAQSGYPDASSKKDLPIPFMFLPNITTRVKVKSGAKIIVEAASGTAGTTFDNGTATADYLAVRMTFQGYKLTMPV
jgi:hypothetical protein